MKKILILICLLVGFSAATNVTIYTADAAVRTAQKKLVCFKVLDNEGNPIPFASVQVKGTSIGVVTDLDGSACIELTPGQTLVISAIGYMTKEVVYTGQKVITLQWDN